MIIVDTSGVMAANDPRQAGHDDAAGVVQIPQHRILSPFVLAEIDYLITTRVGQLQATSLLGEVARGVYDLAPFSNRDVAVALEIMEQYATLNIGIADASIVVLAARYECLNIFTLDQRHFRAVTSLSGQPFRLLPADA